MDAFLDEMFGGLINEMVKRISLDIKNKDYTTMLNFCVNVATSVTPDLLEDKKSNRVAASSKKEGDSYMKQKRYQDAIKAYTEGMQWALPSSEILKTCWYSRIQALQELKAYDECLADIENGLKVLDKDAKTAALEIQKVVLEAVSKNKTSKNKKPSPGKVAQSNVTLSYGENPEVPGASNAIKLAYDKTFGRGFVATQPIKMGDVLLVQEPYMVLLNHEMITTYCHYCIKETRALIPCDACTKALYCSKECATAAYNKYHKVECKLPKFELGISDTLADSNIPKTDSSIIRLFLLVTKQGSCLKETMDCVKELKDSKDPRTKGFTNGQFVSNSERAVLSLSCHEDKAHLLVSFSEEITAVLTILYHCTDICKGHDIYEVARFLHLLTLISKLNNVMIRRTNLQDVLGNSLYPTFNLLNHSCANNTIWYTCKNNIRVLLASKDIMPGEQIFNNYLAQGVLLQDATSRKKLLSSTKFFTCNCEACSKDYSFKREIRRLRVPSNVQRQLRKNPIHIESMWEVLKCMNNVIKRPCADVEIMKFALMEAYLGHQHTMLLPLYRNLGIV